MRLEFFGQVFEKYPKIKFHENPSIGSRVVPCGRMDGQTWRSNWSLFAVLRTPKNPWEASSCSASQVLRTL